MTGGTGSESFAISCPTLNAVNMYERKGADGIYYPINDTRSGYKFDPEHAFIDRDPRFYNNILIPGDTWGTYASGKPITFVCGEVAQPTITMEVRNIPTDDNYPGFMCRKFLWPEANYRHDQTLGTTKPFLQKDCSNRLYPCYATLP